ncbi:MAG: pyridoxal-phosphate dependent enzyme [Pyrodictiaceae archaeon]
MQLVLHDISWRVKKDEPSLWRYSTMLPYFPRKVSFGEGYTPLRRYSKDVFLKLENMNPTGSYSDRASSVIASYFESTGLLSGRGTIIIEYNEDFALSIAYYLHERSKLRVFFREPGKANPIEVISLERLGAEMRFKPGSHSGTLSYINPLSIEGLKTITLEVIERSINVENIIAPAETGLLSYSIAKGLEDARKAGIETDYNIVAVLIEDAEKPSLLDLAEQRIKTARVSSEEVVKSIVALSRKGIWVKPLSAAALAEAENRGRSIAIITSSLRRQLLIPVSKTKRSRLKEEILKTIRVLGEATAYEVWERLQGKYTLRGVYKALKGLEQEGTICSKYKMQGRRRIKVYYECIELDIVRV